MRQLQSKARRVILSLLPGLPIVVVVVLARLLGFWQPLEWQAFDLGLRSRPAEPTDPRITIVPITEEVMQTLGQYPIPGSQLTQLIEDINQYQPQVIGLDLFRDLPIEPGHQELLDLIETSDNLVVINRILPPAIAAPATAPEDRIGFVDTLVDTDGFVRRSLLGATDSNNNYRFSFTLRVAERYLAEDGIFLENGIRNPAAMRFQQTELTPFQANTGSYVHTDARGEQTLINFRSGSRPFEFVTYGEIQAGTADPVLLSDRIVLIGVTAPAVKDIVNTAAVIGDNPGLVTGIELQAHGISQILSAVLDSRSLLRVWPDWLEYGWIIGWGLLGGLIAQRHLKIARYFLVVVAISGGLVLLSYSLLILSWWIPIVPAVTAFFLNSLVLYPAYRSQHELKLRLDDRQQLIERTFDQIHNGPLQKLAMLLQRVSTDSSLPLELEGDLRSLNQDLRSIYEAMRQEFLSAETCLRLEGNCSVRLDQPLHEMLYEVYKYTLERKEFPHFAGIKIHIRKFEPMAEQKLSVDRRRDLGRFLEEALCNVGKYAKNCSRLTVICAQENSQNVIRIIDNGSGEQSSRVGRGTQQARTLARHLRGSFERTQQKPRGICAELRWPIK